MGNEIAQNAYEFESIVRYSEVDHDELLTLPALINYFQDASTFQSEHVGFGMHRLKAARRAWVLSAWQIEIDRYPKFYERVRIGTYPTSFRRMLAERAFYIADESGELVARANSNWVFINLETGHPTSPAADQVAAYPVSVPLTLSNRSRKIALPEHLERAKPIEILPHHIDTNEHVNNGQYVQMALDVAPQALKPRALRVSYQKSAVLGDTIYPSVGLTETGTVVKLAQEDGTAFAVVDLQW